MRRLRELPGFVRINICLYTASLAAIGYLLYNRPDQMLFYATLSAFFGCAAAYAYNNTTDLKEDLINRKKLNYFSDKPAGRAIVALCTITGLSFALQLPMESVLVYFVFTVLFVAYSSLRIKKHFLLKNIWTAVGITQTFLMGAIEAGEAAKIAPAYLTIFMLALAASIIADMRDMEGDRKTGIRTLPVRFGIRRASGVVYALFAAIIAVIITAEISALYLILPFASAAAVLVARGKFPEAHATGGLSFTVLLVWLLLSGV